MKIVKLNRRFRRFKEAGHAVALRFDCWGKQAIAVEQMCRARLGSPYAMDACWEGYFGQGNRLYSLSQGNRLYSQRPYWISFRNEKDLTLVLLCVNLTPNG